MTQWIQFSPLGLYELRCLTILNRTIHASMESKKNKEVWAIHPPYEVFYIERIFSSAQSAILSWENLTNFIQTASNFREIQMMNPMVIRHCDNIISHAGVISRYFQPSKPGKNDIHKLRGEKLSESYGIVEGNIILDRGFRNHVEHFDENLDKFLTEAVAGNIFPTAVFQDKSQLDGSITHVFKAFVINQNTFISLGKEISLLPLIEELYRIVKVSTEFLENGRLS